MALLPLPRLTGVTNVTSGMAIALGNTRNPFRNTEWSSQ